jgi:hypothetical protein
MHSIAYTLLWGASWGSGILKKVVGQVGCWLDASYRVHIFMCSSDDGVAEQVHRMDPRIALTVRRWHDTPSRFVQHQRMLPMVQAWEPDIIYHRFAGYYPAIVSLARRYPMVFEINTDDEREYALKSAPRFWYNRLTRGELLRQGRGMVYVTGELAHLPIFTRFGKPGVVIGNGIDLAQYRPLPPAANDRPHLVFIGSPRQPWHGTEQLVTLATLCPDWQFDVVGLDASELPGPVPPNLCLHGFLVRPDYEPIVARADVALGTLAMHRKDMQEGSTLKFGEYLAYGLPVIAGYTDNNAPDSSYVLEIPNTPDNVQTHLGEIRRFVERVRGTRVPRDQVVHIDVREKERQRLAFLRRIAGDV